MALPIRQNYYKITMPCEKLINFYMVNLYGKQSDSIYYSASQLSKKLDEFVSSPKDIQQTTILIDIPNDLKGIIFPNNSTSVYNEDYKLLRTKYSCALIIKKAREIEKLQESIEVQADLHSPMIGGFSKYIHVPLELFDKMKYEINQAHNLIESLEKKTLLQSFKDDPLECFSNEVSYYYPIFDLDYTPLKEKVGNSVTGCSANIILYGVFFVIFFLLAKCATS